MTKSLKKLSAIFLSLVLVLGTVDIGGSSIADLLGFKASADETTYAVGDIIEYGTYPQSKVEDEELIAALNSLAGDNADWTSYGYLSGTGEPDDGNMTASDYMRYTDVLYDGNKYRGVIFDTYRPYYVGGVSTTECQDEYSGPHFSFQGENGYSIGNVYWFEYEPLTWRILDPDTGLVMCNSIIDSQAFNNYALLGDDEEDGSEYYGDADCTYYVNNYSKSSIRDWLNDDFYNTAFSASQKEGILKTVLDNSAHGDSKYDAPSTTDKIYLLSYSDTINTGYGFSSGEYDDDTARRFLCSDYAKCQGCGEFLSSTDYCGWLLRTAGDESYSIYGETENGYSTDYSADETCSGIVPAMNLSSFETDEEQTYAVGDIIEYGTYPQSKVEDEELITALNALTGDNADWTSYGYYSGSGHTSDGKMAASDYMRYKDVICNGEKYRGVTFDSYRPYYTGFTSDDSVQSENGYYEGGIYWFKYEPIKWRVLDPDTGMVVCDSIIDSQAYNNYMLGKNEVYYGNSDCTFYANNYAGSSIREWLNDDFYNTAFSADQKTNILTTTLDNSAYSTTFSKYDSVTTSDKVYLLSYSDVLNSSYGFKTTVTSGDTNRILEGTDYSKAQGLDSYSNESSAYDGYAKWHLRSAGKNSNGSCVVYYDGRVDSYYTTDDTEVGIVPAMNLQTLKSDTAGSETAVSNGDGTHSVYDENADFVATESCTYTETTDKCTVTYTCSECGYSYDVITHTPADAVQENIVMPTETAKGSYDDVIYCSVCNAEISRETKTIPVGFISASCDKAEMLRGQTATFTITTTTDVTWIKLNGSYTTAAGDVKALSSYYKYNGASNVAAGITVTDADGIRTWTIPVSLSYTVSDASVTETWKITYKLSGSSDWYTAMKESGDYASQLVIYRNASAMPSAATVYEKYSLVSADTDKTEASVGDTVTFTVRATSDVTKVRIGYNYTANGASKTKAVTYQTTSSNVKGITDNGDGTSTWIISYKVPSTASGETAFNIQVRGEAWGTAQSKTITVA